MLSGNSRQVKAGGPRTARLQATAHVQCSAVLVSATSPGAVHTQPLLKPACQGAGSQPCVASRQTAEMSGWCMVHFTMSYHAPVGEQPQGPRALAAGPPGQHWKLPRSPTRCAVRPAVQVCCATQVRSSQPGSVWPHPWLPPCMPRSCVATCLACSSRLQRISMPSRP